MFFMDRVAVYELRERRVSQIPLASSVVDASPEHEESRTNNIAQEETMDQARVGGKAPDFEVPAYHKGQFTKVKLSDYVGKWVVLCFYPGDFTFV